VSKARDRRPAPSVQQMAAYPPPAVAAGGKTYRLGFDDQNAKGRLEELIRGSVWERVYAEADRMPPAVGERHVARYDGLFDAGHYATFGPGWQRTLTTPDGVTLFLLSFLQAHHPDMTPADAAALFAAAPRECRRALGVIAPDFFRAAVRQRGATAAEADALMAAPETAAMLAALAGDDPGPAPPTPAPGTGSA